MTAALKRSFPITLSIVALAVANPVAAQTRPIDVRLRGYEFPVRLDTLAVWTVIPAKPAVTFSAVRQMLASVRVPVTVVDSARGILHQPPVNTSRKIMGKRMSWAFNCGDGFTGPNADSFRIHLTYALFLEPTVDGNTRVGVAALAGANNTDGAYRSAIACGSTGAFEQELAMLIRAQAQLR